MRNIYTLLFLCIGIQISNAQKSLTTEEISTFKSAVEKLDSNTQTIVSDFVQYKHLSFLSNDVETQGKLAFKVPGLVKWEYTSPYKYIVIFKDDKLFIDDEGDKSKIDIGSNKMFKGLNSLITNSVKGNMFDENAFEISYFKVDDFYLVKFIPKDENMLQFIAKFELKFDIKTSDVTEVKMIEPSEDYTKIIFKNKTRNTTLDEAVFNN
ncbi:outer membrane lipoprotein carrier protein LolA [Winogradskyella undariae]|uniref:outer membrane lipoprotein carrier protein LolA n=1 Tax=Winogradskyella undariae TaxID=1285465 RepID=UPI00156B0F91|nr:outer membrane lipoprotein carrier protein LolA [Winogradskyella undariae]NRR90947.1 outer membrane lipoprotein carrier protein LolA [Winogradskyella undariae]